MALIARLVALLAGLALVPLALVLVVLAALQSEAVRGWSETLVDRLVPGVRIAGLGPGLPTRLELARLELADDAGTWLTVEDITLRWSPAALFGGAVVVERVAAGRIALARTPAPAPAAPPTEPAAAPPDAAPFALPERLPPVRVEALAVDRIELGAAVVGEAAVFGLDGRLDATAGGAAELRVELARLDRRALRATLVAAADLAEPWLDLDLRVEETSGLLAALTGEPRLAPFTLELAGSGPLAEWPGTLAVAAGGLARLDADLGLALIDTLRLDLDGRLAPGAELAETPYAPLLRDGVGFDLAVARPGTDLVLERLRVEAAALTARGEGALRGERVQLDLAVDAPDLAALAPLAGTDLAGSASLQVALDGALPLPPGTVRLEATDVRAGGVTVGAVDQRVELAAVGADTVAFAALGTIAEVVVPAGEGRFEERFALDAEGRLTPGGPFALERFELDGRSVGLAVRADGDLGTGRVDLDAELRTPDLTAFRPFSSAAPAGAFALELAAALDDGFATGTVRLDGGARGLSALPPAAQALAGPTPTLAATARLAGAEAPIRLDELRLEGALVDLDGAGAFAPATGRGEARATLTVPALAPLGEALGQPLDGALALTLDAAGGADAIDAEAVLTADALRAAGQAFERVRVALTAAGPPSRLTGEFDARAVKPAGDATLASAYTLTAERLELANLRLAAPGVGLDGALDVALAPLALDGRLAGGGDDLAGLGRWLDVPLAGALDVALALDAAAGQTARLDLAGRRLDAAGVAIERVGVDAEAKGLFATPAVEARAEVSGLTSGATTVDRAAARVAGGLDALAVTFDAEGALPQPFELAGAAEVALGAATTVELTRLDGAVDELPVRLAAPTRLRLDGATLVLDGLDLELDTGRLQGDVRLGPSELDGRVELAGLRLERLGGLGVPPLAGELGARMTLAGTRARPVIDGALALGELRPPGSDGAAAAVELAWRLGGDRLDATLTTDGFGEPALGAEARLPLRFALAPFALELPQPIPLDAELAGIVDLARVAAWYGLEGRILRGRLTTDLAVAGDLAAPRFDGGVRLADGRFVDLAAGLLLDDLALDVTADGRRLVVRELRATDGIDGRLGGSGAVDLGAVPPAIAVDAAITRFAVVQREDLFVVASGEAAVAGEGAALDVRGEFTVEQGEIFLASGGGAKSFATLDVVERDAIAAGAGEEAQADDAADVVELDVTVNIPGRLFVRGRGLVSEWGGALAIGGTAAAPRIDGTIAFRRGFFDLFDRRFQLRRGEIRFTGASPPDPFLDVEAAVELPESTILVRASGPALDPDLGVASEPPLPEDEVLSRLLFDRDQAQLNALQALRLAAAIDQLRGGGPGALDRLRGLLGVDTLEIGGEGLDDASVTAGTYVSEDVFVEIERGLDPGSGGARVEVELTPRIRLETRVRDDSRSSIGLRWSHDY